MTFDEWYSTYKHQLANEPVCRMIWDAAVESEREACAKICDPATTPLDEIYPGNSIVNSIIKRDMAIVRDVMASLAKEIRERGA